jgi:serine/threonine protein kinase/tetratricopeptide (TPR) repeat protein
MNEESLFAAALAKATPAERQVFLDQACAGDDALRRRLDRLLAADEQARGILEGGPDPAAVRTAAVPSPLAAERVLAGRFKLRQKLGEGGMGEVWVADQSQPVQRRVALKVVRAGLDSASLLARFQQERQALALMDHPHIAKVLDAGLDEAGRPYFAMELIKGLPITAYCDQARLPPRQRLELFTDVCHAVQHAHQKGIIHRDLKPSNVMVGLYDGVPVPKVIDFGVAKATGPRLTEQSVYTEVGTLIGTLEYMSPEQAELNNLDIDTRSDIYALGVLLYELLTGRPPFTCQEREGAGVLEMLRVIREQEPTRPSTKLSTAHGLPALAANRGTEPRRLTKLVRGELDWIVLKALEKDRNRRYQTANGLALDVQRYLADEPVQAGPPGVRYRLGKFVRKHRRPVVAALVFALLLVGGIVGTSLGFVRAQRLRQVAEDNQRQAMEALRATTDDVVEQLIGSRPALGPAERAFLEATLERWQAFAAEQGDSPLARQVRAEGVFRVALLRSKLGEQDAALAGYRQVLALREQLAGEFPAVPQYRQELATSHNNLGRLLHHMGQRANAEAAYRQALALREQLAGEFPAVPQYRQELATSHNNLGRLLLEVGKGADAEAALRQALAIQEQLTAECPAVPQYHQGLARSHYELGILLRDADRRADAEGAYRQALALRDKLAAEFPAVPQYRQELAESYNNLGVLLRHAGRRADAEGAYRQALALRDKLAADFPAVPRYRTELGGSQVNFGGLLRANQQPEQALQWYDQAIATLEGVLRHVNSDATAALWLRNAHYGRARALDDLKRHAEAAAAWDKAVELSPPPQRAWVRLRRALSRVRAGQVDAAIQEAQELAKDADAATLYDAACVLGLAAGRPEESAAALSKEQCARRAVALLRQAVAQGFKDAEHMKKDEGLQALRPRDDFKGLLAELGRKAR